MKKALSLLICIGFMILSATGCQKTPSETIVGNKQESVEQKVASEVPEETPTDDVSNKVQKIIDTGNEKITVTIDAEIQKPEMDRLPVVKIETRNFTQEEADKIINTLFGDRTLYQPWEKTKAEYEPQIIHLRQIVSDPESTEEEREMARLQLEFYERQYQKAPETVEKEPTDTHFVTVDPKDEVMYADEHEYTSEGDIHQEINIWAGDGNSRSILFMGNIHNGANSHMGYSNGSPYLQGYTSYESAISGDQTNSGFKLEDAKKFADEAMAKMGIALDMTALSLVSYVKVSGPNSAGMEEIKKASMQAYMFYYTRHVNGIPVTYDKRTGHGALDEEYERAVYYEMASLVVDENGIRFMEYRAPYNVIETVEDNSKIIDVEEAVDQFEKQMKFKYEAAEADQVFDINIHSIVLGLSRIKSGDGGLLLVPTWDFMGNIMYRPEDSAQLMNPPSNTSMESINPVYSIMTINAIDGTIIDKKKGY